MRISDKNSVLDDLDIEILNQLNADSSIANSRLAEVIGLAASTTLMRVRGLLQRGIIQKFTLDIDYNKLGLGVQAIVFLSLRRQDEATMPND
jgi:DNA-binding Lrp family transcriptional regulator